MEQLQVYWIKTKDAFWMIVSKIESSVFFERLVSKYDALPPRNQKTIKASATILAAVLVAWFALSPVVKTRLEFAENRSFFSLISSMKLFNTRLESARKEYVAPVGWQNIQAANLRQLEDSITVMMAGLGLQEDQYEIAPQGNTLLVHAKEATIKQLESFMFQMDGLYPRFSVVRNKTSRNPTNKELIQFEIEIAPGEVKDSSAQMNLEPEAGIDDSNDIDALFNDQPAGQPMGGSNSPSNGAEVEREGDLSVPPPTGNGGVPGFEPPSFTPLEGGDGDGAGQEFNPSNRNGGGTTGGNSDFVPPMGDDFIPPPPPVGEDEIFNDAVPMEEFPPAPPTE